jgi:predicted nucleic acid-binding protein
MFTGVLDANMIIALAKGGVFHLLASLFQPLYVPSGVVLEVVGQGQGLPGSSELAQALGQWVSEVTPTGASVRRLGIGLRAAADRQVIAVAHSRAIDYILTSDGEIIQEAVRHGLACLEVTDVIVLMKRRGLVPLVQPILDRMRQNGFGMTDVVYQATLALAGE